MIGRLAQPYLRTSWGRVRYREHFGRGALIYISARHPRWMRRLLTTVDGYGLRNECEAVGGWQNPEGG